MNTKLKAGSQELWFFWGCFAMIFLFLPVHSSFAQFHYELTPSISVSETYDDNIYLNSSDETSDYITEVTPGLSLNILSQNTQLELTYAPTFVRYDDEDENNTVRHSGTLILGHDLTQHLRFDLTDTYIFSEEPLEETEGIEAPRVTPDERYTYQRNIGTASLRYLFGAENVLTVGYTHSLLDNEDVELSEPIIPDDGTIQTPFATLAYWFNVKNGLELDYEYVKAGFDRKDDFEPEDDYTGHGTGIRYLYRFTPHTTGSVGYDYTTRDFDGLEEDYEVHEGSAGFDHTFSPDLSVSLVGGYFVQKNDYSDDETGATYEASLMKTFSRGSFTIGGSGGWDEAYLEAERRGFTRYWSANASIEYQILEPLMGYAGGSYRTDEDDADDREWTTWRGNCGLTWDFLRWYALSLDYTYADRDDDVDTDDYTVNRVMLRLTASRLFRW